MFFNGTLSIQFSTKKRRIAIPSFFIYSHRFLLFSFHCFVQNAQMGYDVGRGSIYIKYAKWPKDKSPPQKNSRKKEAHAQKQADTSKCECTLKGKNNESIAIAIPVQYSMGETTMLTEISPEYHAQACTPICEQEQRMLNRRIENSESNVPLITIGLLAVGIFAYTWMRKQATTDSRGTKHPRHNHKQKFPHNGPKR